ncbi:hypothetical protein CRG98_013678 [Punica granatum]|uniref:Uncharacterized protein n=1 Tax=Punica granatum TaxID=22663 RepID=A0A2I0KBL7_PUNGR|nr:hypothetical protein CRG98_013678 [Punica granatum]
MNWAEWAERAAVGPSGRIANWAELGRRELGRLSYRWTGLGCRWTRAALLDAGWAVGRRMLGEEARATGNARIRSRDGGPGRGVGSRDSIRGPNQGKANNFSEFELGYRELRASVRERGSSS